MQLLDKKRAGRSWTAFAAEIGISQSLLSRIRQGLATPGPTVLAYLGLQEKKIYVPIEQK